MISSLQYCILCKQKGELSVDGHYRGGVCLFPMYLITLFNTSTQALRSLCLELLYYMGVPFLHAPFRQRVGLGLGPMIERPGD